MEESLKALQVLAGTIRVKIPITHEELWRKFALEFADRGWSVRRDPNVFTAENGKNISMLAIVALFILGLILVPFLLVGVLLWIIAIVIVIRAEPHRVILVREDELYRLVVNSEEARLMASRFLLKVNAEVTLSDRESKDSLSLMKMVEELIDAYTFLWGGGREAASKRLERDIKKLMKIEGLSRGEAIKRLYRKYQKQ